MGEHYFFLDRAIVGGGVEDFSCDLRQVENNAYAKFWRAKKEYYGKFENGL